MSRTVFSPLPFNALYYKENFPLRIFFNSSFLLSQFPKIVNPKTSSSEQSIVGLIVQIFVLFISVKNNIF